MDALTILLFIILQLIVLLFTFVSLFIISVRCLILTIQFKWRPAHRKVSSTALGPLSYRWIAHQMGVRTDQMGKALFRELFTPIVHDFFAEPLLFCQQSIFSYCNMDLYSLSMIYKGGMLSFLEQRTNFFDRNLLSLLSQHEFEQFVILGAGFDTRMYKFAKELTFKDHTVDFRHAYNSKVSPKLKRRHIKLFEVDSISTQVEKRRLLLKLRHSEFDESHIGETVINEIKFVPVDFNNDNLLKELSSHGFDPKKKTLFLWEGVVYYLEKSSIDSILSSISSICKGSYIMFDYFTNDLLFSNDIHARLLIASASHVQEPFKTVFCRTDERDDLIELASFHGFQILEDQSIQLFMKKHFAGVALLQSLPSEIK